MKKSFLVIISLFAFSAQSAIHKVIKAHAPGEFGDHYSLFMNNGEIFELDKSDQETFEIIEESIANSSRLEMELIKSEREEVTRTLILSAKSIVENSQVNMSTSNNKEYFLRNRHNRLMISNSDPLSNYDLVTYRTYDIAQEVMDTFNGNTHDDSQCYARAHMWTYEAFLEYGDNLGKVWMFFGDKYIKEFGHKWWFHVAPYAHIEDYSMPMVLDRGFTKSPYQLENWKNFFIKNKASCRTIYRYDEYERNTNREYCFLMFSSSYYWQPRDLEALGRDTRNFRWGYVMSDLDWSYNDALGTKGMRAPYSRSRENHNAYRY